MFLVEEWESNFYSLIPVLALNHNSHVKYKDNMFVRFIEIVIMEKILVILINS